MDEAEEILKNIDKIMGTNKYNRIDKTRFPLLLKIFEKFREDIDIQTKTIKTLKKEKLQVLEKIDNSFNEEQKRLFEKYWEIENKQKNVIEENIFLFGYLIKNELDIENKIY